MKKIIFAFLILTTTSCFGITETKKISLEQAILSALSTNPQMKMAILDVEKSKNDIKTADKLQNPTVGTFQNMGRAGEGDPHQIGVEYIVELLNIVCDQEKVAPYLVATNDDLMRYAKNNEAVAFTKGWRQRIFGKYVQQMIDGKLVFVYDNQSKSLICRNI